MTRKKFRKAKLVLICLFAYLFCRFLVVTPYRVPSSSMEPSVKTGDIALVFRLAYALNLPFSDKPVWTWTSPAVGDIVVVTDPRDGYASLIKRIVALPGDQIRLVDGVIYRNRQAQSQSEPIIDAAVLDDIYDLPQTKLLIRENFTDQSHWILRNKSTIVMSPRDWPADEVNVQVPPDCIVVFGDNRDNSVDSRSFGFVPLGHIQGKAYSVIWSAFTDYDQNWHLRMKRIGMLLDSDVHD